MSLPPVLDIGCNPAFQPTLPTWLGEGTTPCTLASAHKKGLQQPVYWDLVLKRPEWFASPERLRLAEAQG